MDYFPQALASGQAFCNREDEKKHLKYNIQESRPTLLVSPRRYGKTSLALHVIKQSKLPFAHFDFLSAVTMEDVENTILNGIGKLLGQIEKGPRKVLKLATDLFAGLNIKLSSDVLGLHIEINQKSINPANQILAILERAEKLSKTYNKKIVLLFDEFQRIYQVSENQAIESVIRQITQASKHLAFVFSGSNRHLLNKIFNDRNRPFYKLCDRMTLERINASAYTKYFNMVAKKTNRTINEDAIQRIFLYTERHPYYINLLCFRLWQHETITARIVDITWDEYVFEERSQIANELDLLSNAQRKLLAMLARANGTASPRGQDFINQANMPGATISQALRALEKNDLVYQDHNQVYRVLDPVMKYILAN